MISLAKTRIYYKKRVSYPPISVITLALSVIFLLTFGVRAFCGLFELNTTFMAAFIAVSYLIIFYILLFLCAEYCVLIHEFSRKTNLSPKLQFFLHLLLSIVIISTIPFVPLFNLIVLKRQKQTIAFVSLLILWLISLGFLYFNSALSNIIYALYVGAAIASTFFIKSKYGKKYYAIIPYFMGLILVLLAELNYYEKKIDIAHMQYNIENICQQPELPHKLKKIAKITDDVIKNPYSKSHKSRAVRFYVYYIEQNILQKNISSVLEKLRKQY